MTERLFCKPLLVQVRNGDREERRCKLQIQLDLCTASSALQRKQLLVQLTDEQDLLFLYTLKIDEEDFQNLKLQQGLLVDFPSFPQKFIELLQMCLQEESKDVPKFIVQFIASGSSGAYLNIVETNPFKHLVHLSLKMACGSDADIKKHLADCLRAVKDKNSVLEARLAATESGLGLTLKQTEETLVSRTGELDRLRLEWQARLKEVEATHAQEVAEERQRSLKGQSSYQQKYDQERRDLEQAHIKIVKQLEARAYELDMANKELTDRKYKSESSLHELRGRLAVLDEENGRLKAEHRRLREEAVARDADVQRLDKQASQLGTQLAVLEQQVKDKEQLLSRSSELLAAEQQQKKKLEDDMATKHQQVSKYESSIKTMSDEILKANEIIRKLQAENKNTQAKVKLRSHIALEQEKLLGERERQLESERQRLQQAQDSLAKHAQENSGLKGKVAEAEKHLEEARELNRTNENVINWLNKQINETQMQKLHRVGSMPVSQGGSGRAAVHHEGASPSSAMSPPSLTSAAVPSSMMYSGHTRLPQPLAKSTPIGVGGDGRAHSNDKENNDQLLDAKYLQKNDGALPLRPITNNVATLTASTDTPMMLKPQGRISQHIIHPPLPMTLTAKSSATTHHQYANGGLASAYFPKTSMAANGSDK